MEETKIERGGDQLAPLCTFIITWNVCSEVPSREHKERYMGRGLVREGGTESEIVRHNSKVRVKRWMGM